MVEETTTKHPAERRSETRKAFEQLNSVEFKLPSLPLYLFKLKDLSPNGASFLVKENSDILKHLQVGQKLNMRYHSEDSSKPSEVFISKIKHITELNDKPYKGHYLVGVVVLDKVTDDSFLNGVESNSNSTK